MNGKNFNKEIDQKRILVAPLDWGLGHATRCIPIINELLVQNCLVFIAAEGPVKSLLQQEFPQLNFLPLPGYKIRYSKNKFFFPLKILLQIPKVIRCVYKEHRWLKKIVRQYSIDAILSDNRYGLFHTFIPCVFITHQLTIKVKSLVLQWLIQKLNYYFINKYNCCWVVDVGGENNLAGALSHPKQLPATPVEYLGPLSRFTKKNLPKKYNITIILSGPEPQRSILENILLQQLTFYKGNVLMVRGLPDCTTIPAHTCKHVEIKNFLPATELNVAIEASEIIVCRSGYTSVMDLVILQKKAVLIPTPGQTEQEYLATILMQKNIFYAEKQKGFSLLSVLQKAGEFSFRNLCINKDQYKNTIKKFIVQLNHKNPHQ